MVVGEGYVAVLLKSLDRAIADKDRILALISGVGVSSDGHGKSLWAPRGEGQVKAIQRAYQRGLSLTQLQYIEAHATSTALGDVTEIDAITTVLRGQIPPGKKIAIGGAKLNVGHTLESAGLVGLAKTVLALQHELIPPAIDDRPLNPQVDWDNIPLYVPRREVPWRPTDDGSPRRAGVNAFGIGGLNVHIVVDEFVADAVRLPCPYRRRSRSSVKATPKADDNAIAIIGMGAVMPGALTLEAFQELLASGRDPKTDLPEGHVGSRDAAMFRWR